MYTVTTCWTNCDVKCLPRGLQTFMKTSNTGIHLIAKDFKQQLTSILINTVHICIF